MHVEDFFKEEEGAGKQVHVTPLQEDFGAALSAAALSLGNITKPSMQEPVTSRSSDTLKATMKKLFQARSDRSFLVDDNRRVTGVVTLRDIIMQFSPPLEEHPRMGGFFESALEQSGAHMGPGSVVTVDKK
jgi:CBS domain-containing protein